MTVVASTTGVSIDVQPLLRAEGMDGDSVVEVGIFHGGRSVDEHGRNVRYIGNL